MSHCIKYFMLGHFGIGFYNRLELSWHNYGVGIYRLSVGPCTITYWR